VGLRYSLPPLVLWENEEQVLRPLRQEAASVLGTTQCVGNVAKEQARCSNRGRFKVSFTADLWLEARVMELYRLHLPFMVPLFSPQAPCFCVSN